MLIKLHYLPKPGSHAKFSNSSFGFLSSIPSHTPLENAKNSYSSLGFLSSIPSHTPLENSVVLMYRTTPKSAPVTKTFIPVSRVRLGREERERVEVEREGGGWEEEGGLVRDTVRGCLVLGPDLEGKKESQFANLRCKRSPHSVACGYA